MLLLASLFLMLVSPAASFAQAPLGPVDGLDLPPYDLKRVEAGSMAPDFRLQDENGKVHQLSQYRGKNVVLVMYRGFW
jgi:peroxiredoxin Q/BCP